MYRRQRHSTSKRYGDQSSLRAVTICWLQSTSAKRTSEPSLSSSSRRCKHWSKSLAISFQTTNPSSPNQLESLKLFSSSFNAWTWSSLPKMSLYSTLAMFTIRTILLDSTILWSNTRPSSRHWELWNSIRLCWDAQSLQHHLGASTRWTSIGRWSFKDFSLILRSSKSARNVKLTR